jgi:hypothetical protein
VKSTVQNVDKIDDVLKQIHVERSREKHELICQTRRQLSSRCWREHSTPGPTARFSEISARPDI